MAPFKVLFSLLFSFLLVVKKVESQNTSFAIDRFIPNSALVTYELDAFVPGSLPGSSFVRMTGVNSSGLPLQLRAGRVLYRAPVALWTVGRQASFDTTISLQMTPIGIPNTLFMGHGITFFMVPLNTLRPFGGSGNNLGIYDTDAPIFAVEFDLNNEGIRNPMFQHIGININTIRSQVVTGAALYGNRVTARITYDVPTKKINVVARHGSTTTTLSFYFNLRALLPQQVQIGLSASTGTRRLAFLDVYSWHFSSTMVQDLIRERNSNNTNTNTNTVIKQYVM